MPLHVDVEEIRVVAGDRERWPWVCVCWPLEPPRESTKMRVCVHSRRESCESKCDLQISHTAYVLHFADLRPMPSRCDSKTAANSLCSCYNGSLRIHIARPSDLRAERYVCEEIRCNKSTRNSQRSWSHTLTALAADRQSAAHRLCG